MKETATHRSIPIALVLGMVLDKTGRSRLEHADFPPTDDEMTAEVEITKEEGETP